MQDPAPRAASMRIRRQSGNRVGTAGRGPGGRSARQSSPYRQQKALKSRRRKQTDMVGKSTAGHNLRKGSGKLGRSPALQYSSAKATRSQKRCFPTPMCSNIAFICPRWLRRSGDVPSTRGEGTPKACCDEAMEGSYRTLKSVTACPMVGSTAGCWDRPAAWPLPGWTLGLERKPVQAVMHSRSSCPRPPPESSHAGWHYVRLTLAANQIA